MSLLQVYKDNNRDVVWRDRFFSLSKGKNGRVFNFTNTNFRTQNSFIDQFKKFEKIEGKDRGEWEAQDSHKQEIDKQRVIPMLEAKLFQRLKRKSTNTNARDNYIYKKTEKGISYRRFIDLMYTKDENWIINYIYLLNGDYGNDRNHVIAKTKKLLNIFSMLKAGRNEIEKFYRDFISAENKEDLIKKDLFYIMSFYDDVEFIEIYLDSSEHDKEELHEYILQNLKLLNNACCISHKYRTGGNYSYAMAIDEVKVFYYTYLLLSFKSENVNDLLENLFIEYTREFDNIDKNKVLGFFKKEQEVIDLVLLEALGIEIFEEIEEIGRTYDVNIETEAVPFIDTTTKEGKRKASQIFAMKKKTARELADYKCSLEVHRMCQNHYFKSKTTERNYIEVHHLIPKEFSNRFESSIEVLANYVTLCPSCHQLVHKAVDGERKPLLNYLLDDRKEKLASLNLEIEGDEIKEFYGID